MPLHVSSTCAHHQEVKTALHSLWYHHNETSEWSKITKIQFYKYVQIVAKRQNYYSVFLYTTDALILPYFQTGVMSNVLLF